MQILSWRMFEPAKCRRDSNCPNLEFRGVTPLWSLFGQLTILLAWTFIFIHRNPAGACSLQIMFSSIDRFDVLSSDNTRIPAPDLQEARNQCDQFRSELVAVSVFADAST
jgi:hypothetical protein